MMKRNHFQTIVLLMIGIMIPALLLSKYYGKSLESIIEDTLISIFTGCVFAIPSGIILVVEHTKRQRRLLHQVLDQLQSVLDEYLQMDIDTDVETLAHKILPLYVELCTILGRNYMKSAYELSLLVGALFTLGATSRFQNDGSNNQDITIIKQSIGDCLLLIRKLKKKI